MQEDLVHLDASINLFAPDVDPLQIKPRSLGGRNFWNETQNFRPLRIAQERLFSICQGVKYPPKCLIFHHGVSAAQTPRRTNKINRYFVKGEAQKLTLAAMREDGEPLNSGELTVILLASKGLAPTNGLVARILKNVVAFLRRYEGTLLVQVTDKDEPGGMKWALLLS